MTEKKVTIKGVPPTYDEVEYQRRVAVELHRYHSTTDCMVHVTTSLPHDFLEAVAAKVLEGFTVARNQRVVSESLNYSCYLKKPEAEQVLDIAAIHAKVKTEYVTWLQSEHTRYQDLLRQQLIQAQQEKELKAQREKEAKQLAEIEKQVLGCYKPLEIPE